MERQSSQGAGLKGRSLPRKLFHTSLIGAIIWRKSLRPTTLSLPPSLHSVPIMTLQCLLLLSSLSLSPERTVGTVGNFLGSVLLQQKFEEMDGPVLQLRVTAQFYLASKGKYILKVWGPAYPNDTKRREAPSSILAPLFICFFILILSVPYVNWANQEGYLFYLRFSLWGPWTFLCSIFMGFSLPWLLATTIWTPFSYSNYLTEPKHEGDWVKGLVSWKSLRSKAHWGLQWWSSG